MKNNITKNSVLKATILMGVTLMTISPAMAGGRLYSDSLVLSQQEADGGGEEIIGMPSPIKEFETAEEAQESLDFKTKVPNKIPEGYNVAAFETISDKLLQIVYSNGENEITYRTAQGTDDITGDYNKYAYIKKLKYKGADVTIKGNGEKVYNVLCTKNNMAYSIFAEKGVSFNEIKSFLLK